jgi:N-acyl-L-homoserine lactone synthetase
MLKVDILVARTSEHLNAAYKLRYEVFTLEQGRQDYADHHLEAWVDPLDRPQTSIIVAVADGEVIGTMRFVPRSTGEFLKEESYQLHLLSVPLGMATEELKERLGLIDRGVVRKDSRGRGLNRLMLVACQAEASNMGCMAVIGTTADARMLSSLLGLGWRQYGESRKRWGDDSECCYKNLQEIGEESTTVSRTFL